MGGLEAFAALRYLSSLFEILCAGVLILTIVLLFIHILISNRGDSVKPYVLRTTKRPSKRRR